MAVVHGEAVLRQRVLPWSKSAKRFSSSARTAIADTATAATECRKQARRQQRRVRQQAAPTEPGRTARSSRPPAGVPVPPASTRLARDGSRFPFDHFPGIIRMWKGRCTAVEIAPLTPVAAPVIVRQPNSRACGCAAGSAAASGASSIHFHAFHDEGEPSHDQSGNPRADSPLFLRRTLEDRHDCQ